LVIQTGFHVDDFVATLRRMSDIWTDNVSWNDAAVDGVNLPTTVDTGKNERVAPHNINVSH
jgi:hypothetical protein